MPAQTISHPSPRWDRARPIVHSEPAFFRPPVVGDSINDTTYRYNRLFRSNSYPNGRLCLLEFLQAPRLATAWTPFARYAYQDFQLQITAISSHYILEFLIGSSLLTSFVFSLVGLAIERRCPTETNQPRRDIILNLGYLIVQRSTAYTLAPLASGVSIIAVNAVGGGALVLPGAGWGTVWAIPLYVFTMDLSEYLFHRAQHASQLLWAMHSLHHSDKSLNVTTATRHFWVETSLKALFVYPFVGLLLQPSPAIIVIYAILTYWNFVVHMNVPLSFGRFWFVLNSPHYHRIHHGSTQVYANHNFAALLPVYDILFRTFYRPTRDEYPATGVSDGDAPRTLLEAILWPIRRQVCRRGQVIAADAGPR
jgi:sterol desaturase/sphingolipid hydroxylase (fatty acid hydroxylase superfamily)